MNTSSIISVIALLLTKFTFGQLGEIGISNEFGEIFEFVDVDKDEQIGVLFEKIKNILNTNYSTVNFQFNYAGINIVDLPNYNDLTTPLSELGINPFSEDDIVKIQVVKNEIIINDPDIYHIGPFSLKNTGNRTDRRSFGSTQFTELGSTQFDMIIEIEFQIKINPLNNQNSFRIMQFNSRNMPGYRYIRFSINMFRNHSVNNAALLVSCNLNDRKRQYQASVFRISNEYVHVYCKFTKNQLFIKINDKEDIINEQLMHNKPMNHEIIYGIMDHADIDIKYICYKTNGQYNTKQEKEQRLSREINVNCVKNKLYEDECIWREWTRDSITIKPHLSKYDLGEVSGGNYKKSWKMHLVQNDTYFNQFANSDAPSILCRLQNIETKKYIRFYNHGLSVDYNGDDSTPSNLLRIHYDWRYDEYMIESVHFSGYFIYVNYHDQAIYQQNVFGSNDFNSGALQYLFKFSKYVGVGCSWRSMKLRAVYINNETRMETFF